MSFNLKPSRKPSAAVSNIDYEAIAAKVGSGPKAARISLIVQLGIQERGLGFTREETTEVDTEAEAEAILDQLHEIGGKDVDKITYSQVGDKFVVNAKIYQKKDAEEVAIFADLPNTLVTYVEGTEALPYRVMLNPSFKGDIKGFPLVSVPPKVKGGVWTFASNSALTRLAHATGHPEILEDGDDNTNIGLILGEPFLVDIKNKNGFINAGAVMPIMEDQVVKPLPFEAIGVSFEGATLEILKKAKLRKGIIDKIKLATNYGGSAIKRAIEALEAEYQAGKSSVDSEDEPVAAKKEVAKPATRKAPPVLADDDSDDLPF